MSLLNQVLIDLDRRRASGEERGGVPDHVRALPHEPEPAVPVRLVALAAVLLVVVALALYRWMPWREGQPAAEPLPAAPAPTQPIASAAPPAAVAMADAPPPAFEAMQPRLEDMPVAHDRAAPSRIAPPAQPRARAAPPASTSVAAMPNTVGAPSAEVPQIDIHKQVRKSTPQQHAEADYEKAVGLLREGRAGEARELLESALRAHPAHAGARQTLTAVLVEARAYADAERLLQEGLRHLPAHSGYAMALARLQVQRNDIAAATETLRQYAEHGAHSADYQGFHAALLQRQQRHEEAVERFVAALRLRPHQGVWLMGLGMSLQAMNRLAEAQDAYRRARAAPGLTPELQAFVEQRLRQVE